MTQNDMQDQPESGEQKLRRRKKAFWTFLALGMVISLIAGLASGIVGANVEDGLLAPWVLFPIIGAITIGFIWFSYRYYKAIDELDLMDNMWANTFGMYGFVIIAGIWILLEQAKLTGPPETMFILFASIAISLLAYLARRLGLR